MTFIDWNMDGKIDMQDEFLEYNVFRACMENENTTDNDDYDGLDEE